MKRYTFFKSGCNNVRSPGTSKGDNLEHDLKEILSLNYFFALVIRQVKDACRDIQHFRNKYKVSCQNNKGKLKKNPM